MGCLSALGHLVFIAYSPSSNGSFMERSDLIQSQLHSWLLEALKARVEELPHSAHWTPSTCTRFRALFVPVACRRCWSRKSEAGKSSLFFLISERHSLPCPASFMDRCHPQTTQHSTHFSFARKSPCPRWIHVLLDSVLRRKVGMSLPLQTHCRLEH